MNLHLAKIQRIEQTSGTQNWDLEVGPRGSSVPLRICMFKVGEGTAALAGSWFQLAKSLGQLWRADGRA